VVLCSSSFAQDRPEPSEAIHYKDIGRRFYIEGDFGKLYTDFRIRGIVLEPTGKDPSGTVRLGITQVRGERLETRQIKDIVTKSKFVVGSEVELLVREEARLWYPEGIDDMLSNPDTSYFHKLYCVVSLHQREILSRTPPGERQNPIQNKNSEQPGPAQPATKPADKVPAKPQPSTPTSEDAHR
jgi:hypothetical protein